MNWRILWRPLQDQIQWRGGGRIRIRMVLGVRGKWRNEDSKNRSISWAVWLWRRGETQQLYTTLRLFLAGQAYLCSEFSAFQYLQAPCLRRTIVEEDCFKSTWSRMFSVPDMLKSTPTWSQMRRELARLACIFTPHPDLSPHLPQNAHKQIELLGWCH